MPKPDEKKVLFAFAPPEASLDGSATLIFMVPQSAWEYMHNGLGHDFDLTKLGIPLKVIIGRCKNRKEGLEKLAPFLENASRTVDVTGQDLGFDKTPRRTND